VTRGPLVVIGDALLDTDLRGTLSRVTPDGKAPVIDCDEQSERPGGAGLAALLAAAPGDRDVVLITGLGDDEAGERVATMLDGVASVIRLPLDGGTPEKARVMTRSQVLMRLDSGQGRVPSGAALPSQAQLALHEAAAVLVADYGRGMAVHPEARHLLAGIAGRLPVAWDPHPRGGRPLPGVRLVTPSEAEALAFAAPGAVSARGDAGAAARRAMDLVRQWGVSGVAVTLGDQGAVLATSSRPPSVAPTPKVSAPDTCGAGDSFAAAVTRALADGLPLSDTVAMGVHAATSFVAAGAASGIRTEKGERTCPAVPSALY
jgi:D-beta-D-heptose 7-phosphate kinase/D-beta-D-heptose 1-phosphate adenosyltransferase